MRIARPSAPHIIGELHQYSRLRLGLPNSRPEGWPMGLMARERRTHNATCHVTGDTS